MIVAAPSLLRWVRSKPEYMSSDDLMAKTEEYWAQLGRPQMSSNISYNEYVLCANALSTRGPEILDWAVRHLRHPEYVAREKVAFLIGGLGNRGLLGDRKEEIIDELSTLAVRPMVEDNKEIQANSMAVSALGYIGDERAIPAMRSILTSSIWDNDDIQLDAVETLSILVDEPFEKEDYPIVAARAWLSVHPN